MDLGYRVTQRFFTALITEAVLMTATFTVSMFEFSPYQTGRLGQTYYILQLGSSAMLTYSGLFGVLTCFATEVAAKGYNMKVLWGAFAFMAILVIMGLWLCFGGLLPVTITPTWVDKLAGVIAGLTTLLALITYICACRYFLRIHRLRNNKPF